MSDVFGLHVYYHVFTSDGDCMVSDSSDGDWRLRALVAQYPDATVAVKDRDTGETLGDTVPLVRLLHDKRELLALSLERRADCSR